jgi:hypothetical protein
MPTPLAEQVAGGDPYNNLSNNNKTYNWRVAKWNKLSKGQQKCMHTLGYCITNFPFGLTHNQNPVSFRLGHYLPLPLQ